MITFLITLLGGLVNRIRGGFLKEEIFFGSTQLVRLLWSVVFACVVFFSVTPFDILPYMELGYAKLGLLVATGFAAWALFGSGAHQELNFQTWKDAWSHKIQPHDTEIFTEWWLPRLFGDTPKWDWPVWKFYLFHVIGKSCEGMLRNFICLLPMSVSHTEAFVVFIGTGLLWGPIYLVACHMPSWVPVRNSQLGEIIVGMLSFGTIALLLI